MQIVIFKLGDEYFAINTEEVRSINDIMNITKVPNAPDYIKGLINLRGSIKSLVDINLLLKMSTSKKQENIIILNIEDEEIGILVDKVEEVLFINENSLILIDRENKEEYIKGIVKHKDKLLTIIDVCKLINKG